MVQKFIEVRPERIVVADRVVTPLVIIIVIPVVVEVRPLPAPIDTSATHVVILGDNKAIDTVPRDAAMQRFSFFRRRGWLAGFLPRRTRIGTRICYRGGNGRPYVER